MKKKIVALLLAMSMSLTFTSCGISETDYNSVKEKNSKLESQLEESKKAVEKYQADYDSLKSEFDTYKEKMKPYEEMEEAEANAKKAEAEAAANAQKAQDEATAAVKKVWDFDNGTLAKGATREAYDAATNKVNALTDEALKTSLNQALTAANDAITQTEQAVAEKEAKQQAVAQASIEQKNALNKAKSYLDFSAFSYSGLVEQLEYEGFSNESSTFAVDNCGADWNEQAAKKAKSYLDFSSFSRDGLIEQLEYEGFTAEQAEYGATAVGY